MQDIFSRKILMIGWVVAALCAMSAPVAAEKPKVADDSSIAAKVNGRPIYLEQFKSEVDRGVAKLRRYSKDAESTRKRIEREELERQVDLELMVQAGEKVSTLDLEKEVEARIKSQQTATKPGADTGKPVVVTDEMRNKFRRQLLIDEFLAKRGMGELRVPEAELKAYYQENQQQFSVDESVKVSHVLIPFTKGLKEGEKDPAREKIEMIREEVKKGKEFAEAAKQYSACDSAKKGGDLGFVKPGHMPKAFDKVAFALKPGELSDVVQTQHGYHLLKVFEKEASYISPFAQVKGFIEKYLRSGLRAQKLQELTQELRRNAKIEISLK